MYVGRIYDKRDVSGVIIEDVDRKIFAVDEAGAERVIPERQDLVNHSPTGFCWGYGGSGPAQAALAICADYYGDDQIALQKYQQLKFGVIARLPMNNDFEIGVDTVILSALPLTLKD